MPPKKATKKQVVQEEPDDLVDFEPDTEDVQDDLKNSKSGQQGYVAIHSSGFRDFLLKPELLKAVVDSGFEHPSEVQHQSIPQAILGTDVLCQAKAGMGKTAVFVLSLLQQIEPVQNQCQALVLCHTRELAFQISKEFVRFAKYLPKVVVSVFFGGISIKINEQALKSEVPNIVVGTPGRISQLVKDKTLDVSKIRHFVLDECDKLLDSLKMRKTIQEIFKATPRDKQVMMFSATLSKDTRELAKKFMSENPQVICVDDETKLVLHGLLQYYIKLAEKEKNKKLAELLDNLEFNQVVIFVRTTSRARDLTKLLNDSSFPAICIHSDMDQQERIERYQSFKNFQARLLVATDVFGRGIDIERVNIVINYDMPDEADSYLHRVGRAGRFGTKGLTISFVSTDDTKEALALKQSKKGYTKPHTEEEVLQQVQDRFAVKIEPLPEKIDVTQYMTS